MGKISKFDLAVLGVTALFLVGTAGYCLHQRNTSQPYDVSVSQREESPSPSPDQETPPLSKLLEGETIDINTASAEELTRLPGIGASRAQDIVDWRTEHGAFTAPEDLMQVSGIGEGIFAGLKDYITLGG